MNADGQVTETIDPKGNASYAYFDKAGNVTGTKDQDGNPVVMSVSPDSVTEISELGTSGGNGTNGRARPIDTLCRGLIFVVLMVVTFAYVPNRGNHTEEPLHKFVSD